VRIHQNDAKFTEVSGLSVQQQHTGLSGDSNSNLIGNFQTAATLEVLLSHENVHKAVKLLFQ
jgi:hypothetical protein